MFEDTPGEETESIVRESEETLEEELGQWLEWFGEQTGWDSLSEFARDHLEGENDRSGSSES